MRIALIGETGGPGGAERMMLHLATELRERGHSVVAIGPERRNPWLRMQFEARGFERAAFDVRWPVDPRALAQIARVLHRYRIDVVHAHDFVTAVYGGAAAWLSRLPFVITMHGGRYYAGRAYRRAALRFFGRRSRALVAVSRATAGDLTRTLHLPPDAVRVVPNGVRVEAADPSAVRRELSLRPGELLVVAVGNLYPVKGHVVLLRALARIVGHSELPPWRLAIAGRGGEESALRVFAESNGLGERVTLMGFRDDVANVIAAADIVAMPSLSEGLPLALAEAMLAGKAIVASGVGGIPEVIDDDREGILVPPGDDAQLAAALRRLLASGELRTRYGDAARRRAAASLTVERMTDEYERLYQAAHWR